MRFNDVKSLHKFILKDGLNGFIQESKHKNISLSNLLDELVVDNDDNIVEQLLSLEGLILKKDGDNLGSTIHELNELRDKNRSILFSCYLDDVYQSCFDSTDTYVGINDLVAYRQVISHPEYRKQQLLQDDVEHQHDIREGYAIPCIRLVNDQQVSLLSKTAIGFEYDIEMINRSKIYLFEITDYVKDIGIYHNKLLCEKFISDMKSDLKLVKVSNSDSIQKNDITGINSLDYFAINKKFDKQRMADTVIGGILPTLKFLVTHQKAREVRIECGRVSDKNFDTVFGLDKDIISLDNEFAKDLQLDDKFIMYNKDSSIVLAVLEHEDDFINTYGQSYRYVRRYFSINYYLHKKDDVAALLCQCETLQSNEDKRSADHRILAQMEAVL